MAKENRWKKKHPATPKPGPALDPDVSENLQAIKDHVTKFAVPLYSEVSATDPTIIVRGTGVLLAVGSHRFLITAAHVGDLKVKEGLNLHFRLPGDKAECSVAGKDIPGVSSISKDSKHYDDPIDTVVLDLPQEHASALESRYEFLTLAQIDPSDPAMPQPSGYVATGFPGDLSGLGVTAQTTKGMILSSVRHAGDLSQVKRFNPAFHAALDYKAHYFMDGGQLKEAARLPDPGGMSGGALWRTFDHGQTASNSGPERVRLVGIVQELIFDPPLLITTQIEYALVS